MKIKKRKKEKSHAQWKKKKTTHCQLGLKSEIENKKS
jgi:hypothetical protein